MITKSPICMFFLTLIIMGFFLLGISLTFKSNGQASSKEQGPIIQDATEYATDQRIPLDEAVRRLEFQAPIGDFIAEIEENEPDTFAGAWIQHEPYFGIIVQFTNNGEEIVKPYLLKDLYADLKDFVEVRTAKITLQELETTQLRISHAARNLGIPFESGINVYKNQVEFYSTNPNSFQSLLEAANVEIPDYVNMIAVNGLSNLEGRNVKSCVKFRAGFQPLQVQ